MILKLIINFSRWIWGLPRWQLTEPLEEAYGLLIMFGACIDIAALIAIVFLTIGLVNNLKRRRAK